MDFTGFNVWLLPVFRHQNQPNNRRSTVRWPRWQPRSSLEIEVIAMRPRLPSNEAGKK